MIRRLLSSSRESLRTLYTADARRLLLLVFLVDGAFAFLFLIAVQSYLPDGRAWQGVAGLALGAYAAGKLAAQLSGGSLTDRLGTRTASRLGLTVMLVGQAGLFGVTREPWMALPGAVVYGAGSAVLWPALYASVAERFESERRARLTSAITATTGLALAAALGLGFLLPESVPFSAACLGGTSAILTALFLVPTAGVSEGRRVPAEAGTNFMKSIKATLHLPGFPAIAGVYFLQSAAVAALVSVFRAYGRDVIQVSLRSEMLLLFPAALACGLGLIAGSVISDKVSRGATLVGGFVLAGASLLALSQVSDPITAAPLLMLAALGIGLALPSTTALALDFAPPERSGMLLGAVLVMEGTGHVTGPFSGALLGGPVSVLVFSAVLFLLAGALSSRASLARTSRQTVAGTRGGHGLERDTPVSKAGSSVDDRPVLLLTGGAGFVGSNIAARFAASWRVILLDDCTTGKETNIPEGVEFVHGDIRRDEELLQVFDLGPIDAIVHCAAQTSVARSMADPELDWDVNVGGTAKLVRLARERGVRRFVFLSSGGAVYGDVDEPAEEKTLPAPRSFYGLHKYAAEQIIRAEGIPYAVLRLSNVYGLRQRTDIEGGVVAIFIEALLAGRPVEIHGDGNQVRDFVYVSDVVDAVEAALASTEDGVWNVASGRPASVGEVLQLLCDFTGIEPAVRYREPRPGDVRYSVLAPSAITAGRVSLADGLERLLAQTVPARAPGDLVVTS